MAKAHELYNQDQLDRQKLKQGLIDWAHVEARDKARIKAAKQLVTKGLLSISAQDLWHLSFIFQHGPSANDSLLAHQLAQKSYKKGYSDALEMVCLTYDRYLWRTKKLQVYGTQYKINNQGHKTHHPIDLSLTDQDLLNQGLPSRDMYKQYLSSILDQKSIDTLIQAGLNDQESSQKQYPWEAKDKLRRKNQKLLKDFIKNFGWPTTSINKEASWAAWLIAQHSDFDVEFQQKCLKLMSEKYKKKLVNPLNYAYLYDRVMVNTGKKQLFATQWDSMTKLQPVARLKDLSNRRKKIGLLPLLISKKLRENTLTQKELESLWQLQAENMVGRFANSML